MTDIYEYCLASQSHAERIDRWVIELIFKAVKYKNTAF
jgi:hypothetical protein